MILYRDAAEFVGNGIWDEEYCPILVGFVINAIHRKLFAGFGERVVEIFECFVGIVGRLCCEWQRFACRYAVFVCDLQCKGVCGRFYEHFEGDFAARFGMFYTANKLAVKVSVYQRAGLDGVGVVDYNRNSIHRFHAEAYKCAARLAAKSVAVVDGLFCVDCQCVALDGSQFAERFAHRFWADEVCHLVGGVAIEKICRKTTVERLVYVGFVVVNARARGSSRLAVADSVYQFSIISRYVSYINAVFQSSLYLERINASINHFANFVVRSEIL